MACECENWCRTEKQPDTDKHHKTCPHYDDEVRVVRISHNGTTYYDDDIKNALLGLAEGDDCEYEIEFMQMKQRKLDALPEFAGF